MTKFSGRRAEFLADADWHDEWDAGHVPGAVHIPMRELGPRQSELPTDRTILCVCRSGNRSGLVTKELVEAGYTVENLDGGLQSWEAYGHGLEDMSGEQGMVI